MDPTSAPSGYSIISADTLDRATAMLPKQGDRKPWRLYQNYVLDLMTRLQQSLQQGKAPKAAKKAESREPKAESPKAKAEPKAKKKRKTA